jgi:hypothetical protein
MVSFGIIGKAFYSPQGHLEGEGYLTMTEDDIQDAKAVDLVININEALRNSVPDGIGFFVFQEKIFIVGKHVATGHLVVLGIKGPNHVNVSSDTAFIQANLFI